MSIRVHQRLLSITIYRRCRRPDSTSSRTGVHKRLPVPLEDHFELALALARFVPSSRLPETAISPTARVGNLSVAAATNQTCGLFRVHAEAITAFIQRVSPHASTTVS